MFQGFRAINNLRWEMYGLLPLVLRVLCICNITKQKVTALLRNPAPRVPVPQHRLQERWYPCMPTVDVIAVRNLANFKKLREVSSLPGSASRTSTTLHSALRSSVSLFQVGRSTPRGGLAPTTPHPAAPVARPVCGGGYRLHYGF